MSKLRSGKVYHDTEMSDGGGQGGSPSPVHTEPAADRMAELLHFLMEDRRKREEELAEERRQRAEEQRREQERRFLDDERRERESQRQMELLQGLLAGIHKQGESAEKRAEKDRDVKQPSYQKRMILKRTSQLLKD